MPYARYDHLHDAREVLAAISQAALAQGWDIIEDVIADTPIDGDTASDGFKLALSNPAGTLFATFRSGGDKLIFPGQGHPAAPSRPEVRNAQGVITQYEAWYDVECIGLIASDAYTKRPTDGLWYNQPGAPRTTSGRPVGVGIPLSTRHDDGYTVFVNIIDDPADLLVVSVTDSTATGDLDSGCAFVHMAVGELEKVGNWDGGAIISASCSGASMTPHEWASPHAAFLDVGSPLWSANADPNTFLRIDMDNAPNRGGGIYWAAACPPSSPLYTGKELALPVRTNASVRIPDYHLLRSLDQLDSGRDVNTLNCISVDLNLCCYVLRDPDDLRNFSPVGYVPGAYFISLKNVAPAQCYETSWPTSGALHQAFPYTRRRGVYGMDGFAVRDGVRMELPELFTPEPVPRVFTLAFFTPYVITTAMEENTTVGTATLAAAASGIDIPRHDGAPGVSIGFADNPLVLLSSTQATATPVMPAGGPASQAPAEPLTAWVIEPCAATAWGTAYRRCRLLNSDIIINPWEGGKRYTVDGTKLTPAI